MARIKRLVSIVGVVTLFGPMVGDVVFGYSGGPVRNVTDLAPTCAGCHSSFTRDQLRNEPEAFATSQIKENKHYKAIEDGTGPYQQRSEEHTSELQSLAYLVCRLLLEKKKRNERLTDMAVKRRMSVPEMEA